MDLLRWDLESLNRIFHFPIIQSGVLNSSEPNSKEANILFSGQDMDCKEAVISSLSDEGSSEYLTSWVSSFGKIKFKFFDLGGHGIAHRVQSDYGAKANLSLFIFDLREENIDHGSLVIPHFVLEVVYVVNADALTTEELLGPREELNAQLWEHFWGPREELKALLFDDAFVKVPFLIFGVTSTGARSQLKERLCSFLRLPNLTIELRSTGTLFQLKERLCYSLRLPNVTIERADINAHPLEVFVAQALHKEEYLDGLQWLSQNI